MANRTVPDAIAIHGTNPQYLIEKIIRTRIYESLYWKEYCFGLTAETLIDRAIDLQSIGGQYGNQKPTEFLCLTLKLLQLQPSKEIIIEFIKDENYKYLRALGAFYLRLVGTSLEIYQYLEPLLNDYRKLRKRTIDGGFIIVHMDEFIDELLREDRVCDIILPRIIKRHVLEENEDLKPRENGNRNRDATTFFTEDKEDDENRKYTTTLFKDEEDNENKTDATTDEEDKNDKNPASNPQIKNCAEFRSENKAELARQKQTDGLACHLEGKRDNMIEVHEQIVKHKKNSTKKEAEHILADVFNIKHLFFQPCDYELIVILHIHLINPIIFGKEKTKYVDEEEVGPELREHRRQFLLNKSFKSFANKIAESSNEKVHADVPFRDIGFFGFPFKTNVLLQPTTDCLVRTIKSTLNNSL
nr:4824_t:CDS:2 [Entrophospora candida]